MDFVTAVKTCFGKYVTFSGRASPSEFWWFALFVWAGVFILVLADGFLFGKTVTTGTSFQTSTNTPYLSGLFEIATVLPSISVLVRRLHDTGRSGWWYWIALIPLVGVIVLIVFCATPSKGPNQYGNGSGAAEAFA